MLTRRALLRSTALIPVAVVLNGCGTNIPGQVATVTGIGAQVVADLQGLAPALQNAFPSIAKALSSDAGDKVQGYLSQLAGLAAGINASMPTTSAQPVVQQIAGVVQQIAGVAGPLLPPPWGIAITAVSALLPVAMAAVGLLTAPQAGGMTPAQARAALGIPTVQ